MIKYYFQVLLFVGVCIALGKGIDEAVSEQSVKDSVNTSVADSVKSVSVKNVSDSIKVEMDSAAVKDTAVLQQSVPAEAARVAATISADSIESKDSAVQVDTVKTEVEKTAVFQPEVSDSIAIKLDSASNQSESTVKPAVVDVELSKSSKSYVGRNGIGLNLMAKIFMSSEINDYLEDIHDMWQFDIEKYYTLSNQNGISDMFFVPGIRIKGIILAGPVLGIEPFGMFNFGFKTMQVSNMEHDIDAVLIEVGGGTNLWARVSPKKIVSFKAGLGVYFIYSRMNVEYSSIIGDYYDDGNAGTVDLTGFGYGVNILAGLDITLKKVTINIDFGVPLGKTYFDREGTFESSYSVRYPDSYSHYGIEIRPGITFNF